MNKATRPDNSRKRKNDRRSFRKMPDTPFSDGNGEIVNEDRRSTPDRRLNNITIKQNN